MRERSESGSEETPAELTGTVVRGAGIAGTGFILSQALTLAAYLALARLATPSDFGEFAAAGIVVSAGLMFTESGMLAALIQRRDRIEEAASTAVVSTALGGVGLSLIALALSPLIGIIFGSDKIATLAAAMSGLLFLRALPVVPEALLQRRFSFLRRMIVEPGQVIAFGTVAILATSNGMGAWGLVLGFYASASADVLLSWGLVGWRPRMRLVSFAMWRELIDYGRHVLISGIALRARDEVPTLLLGAFVGTSSLGQYQYAQRVSSTPLGLLLSAVAYVVLPAFARISEQPQRFRTAFLRSLHGFAGLALPMGGLLSAFGISILVLFFGEVWRDAGEATMILGISTVGASLAALASEALKAGGRPDVLVPAHTTSAVIGALAMAAFLPLGLLGIAIGFTIGVIAGGIYQFVRLRQIFEITFTEMAAEVWPAAVAAAVMTAVMLPVDRLLIDPTGYATLPGLGLLALEGLAAVAIYGATLWACAPSTFRDAFAALAAARH